MKIHKFIAIAFLSTIVFSCDDFKFGNAFLEKPISDEMNIDSVFGNKLYAEQQLSQVYHSLPDHLPINNRLSWCVLEAITDLADMIKDGGTDYHNATITAASTGVAYKADYGREDGKFSAIYGIRQAYIFIENVDRVPDMTDKEKKRRKAEAKVIIAYHYTDMLRHFGGMPWIDHAYTPDDDMKMTRMTIAESVERICKLLDEAAVDLPWDVEPEEDGRMTAASALALKSRIWTFVASPLFNSAEPFRSGEASDLKYTWWGDYDNKRWQKALDAGLEFLRNNNLNGGIYQLVDIPGEPRKSFYKGYFERYNHETLISSHRFTKWDLNSYCVTQMKYGTGHPMLNYADMFQMKDGSEFSWDNPEHRAHPFFTKDFKEVRDPRLYETLIVTGDKFWGRKAEIYKGGREQPKAMGTGQHWRWGDLGHNGISIRKYYQDHLNELQNKFYQCCLMRLPEIYLNIAEAMNELGMAETKDEFGRDAYDYINLVRNRVDMPDITPEKIPSGEALREEILRERAREFGYEEIRYFDIVRWKRVDLLRKPLSILKTYPKGEKVNGHYVEFDYEVVSGPKAVKAQRLWVQEGIWDDKYYLTPIPLDEINKKYGLVQNPGWE